MIRASFFAAALAASLLVGCSAEIPEGRLSCNASEPCPPDWHCHLDGLCYSLPEIAMDAGPRDSGPMIDTGPGTDSGPPMECSDGADCDDSDPCTTDACTGDVCTHATMADGARCGAGMNYCCGGRCVDTSSDELACGATCSVCGSNMECTDGTCTCLSGYQNCDGMLGCESNAMSDPMHCGSCSVMCSSTKSCIAGMCGACRGDGECSDSLTCTTDTCMSGRCVHALMGGYCLISGSCYAMGVRNPANECQECNPALSTTAWSNRTGSCSDGNFCTASDTCSGSACVGAGSPCSTTTPTCDEPMDRCVCTPASCGAVRYGLWGACSYATPCVSGSRTRTVTTPTCSAGGTCTDIVTSEIDTTGCPALTACNDGLYCNGMDMCSGGACAIHSGNPCMVGLVCDEPSDSCRPCGALGEPCCPGRTVDDSSNFCCGADPGTVQECCANTDCNPTGGPWCPGGSSRWECVGGRCCFGPCDGVC